MTGTTTNSTTPMIDLLEDDNLSAKSDAEFLRRWDAAGERSAWVLWSMASNRQRALIVQHERESEKRP